MTGITYHKAEAKDLEGLIDLRIQFTVALAGNNSMEDIKALEPFIRDYFSRSIKKGEIENWYLAKSGGKAVGMGGMVFREHPGNFKNPGGKSAYIINMFTLAEFRRKGICSEILKALIRDAKEKGIPAFELHATEEGEFVYKQLGFEIHNEPTYRMYL